MMQACWIWTREISWTSGSVLPALMPTKTWMPQHVRYAVPPDETMTMAHVLVSLGIWMMKSVNSQLYESNIERRMDL